MSARRTSLRRARLVLLAALACALAGAAAAPARATGILTGYSLIDLSGGAPGAQTYTAPNGTQVAASQAPWSNSAYYYVSYLVDGSYTWNPVTGVWKTEGSPNSNGYSWNGFLGASAVVTNITFTFPTATRIDLARFYPSGYSYDGVSHYIGTDYSLQYWDGTQWVTAISRQVLAGGTSSAYPFYDNSVGASATQWQVTLYDGGNPGAYVGDIPTFGEIQFFQSTAAAAPEPAWLFAAGALFSAVAARRRRAA